MGSNPIKRRKRNDTPQTAIVYVRQGQAFVAAQSRTEDGFWVDQAPSVVDDAQDLGAVAEALLNALEHSLPAVPTPPRDADLARPLLRSSGTSTFGQFMKGTRAVEVSAAEETVVLTPMRHGGPRRGFEELTTASVSAERSTVHLARALDEVLSLAE